MKPVQWAIFGTIWVALLLGGGLGAAYILRPTANPVGPVVPVTNDLATVKAIAASNPAAAKQIGAAYKDFAAIIERPETPVATKSAFRSANQRFQAALWANDPTRPQLPGISDAMNRYLTAKLGAEDGPLNKAIAAAALRDLALALGA